MTLAQYDHAARKECVKLGLLDWQPSAKMMAVYRNAGYSPKEAAAMELEEYTSFQRIGRREQKVR